MTRNAWTGPYKALLLPRELRTYDDEYMIKFLLTELSRTGRENIWLSAMTHKPLQLNK